MKLCILIKKINAKFPSSAKSGIGIELIRTVLTMTYKHTLQNVRDSLNLKLSPVLGGRKPRP